MFPQKLGEEYIGLAKMIIWVFSLHLTSYRKTQMIILANPIFADGGRDQLDQLRDPEDESWKVKSCKHLQRELRTTTHSNNNSAPSSVQFSSVLSLSHV